MSKTKTTSGPAPLSLLGEIKALRPLRERWDFTPEQHAEIESVFAAEDAGECSAGCKRLARIVKIRYDLPWSVTTIATHLEAIKRGRR